MRNYLRTLDDAELRKVAYFLGKGFSDEAVAAAMRMNVAAVQEAKNRLRQGLVEAGAGPEA